MNLFKVSIGLDRKEHIINNVSPIDLDESISIVLKSIGIYNILPSSNSYDPGKKEFIIDIDNIMIKRTHTFLTYEKSIIKFIRESKIKSILL